MNEAPDDEQAWLQSVLTGDIPLGAAMGLRISRLDSQGIRLQLPLAPNINDKGTAFGGAMASAMILAGWSLPRLLLRRAGVKADLVIGRCELRFLKPVLSAFDVVCDWPAAEHRAQFLDRLAAAGKGALTLEPRCEVDGTLVASLSARYAALVHQP